MSPLSNNGEASSFTQRPAAQSLPDLTGKTSVEADQELEKAGFKQGKTTAGGYQHWKHSDGSEIWIRPNGEIVRVGPKIKSTNTGKLYSPRFGPDGRQLKPTDSHNTGEIIIIHL